jgi:hypothetical protein
MFAHASRSEHQRAIGALRVAAPAETGASAWNGMLIGRILTPDSARLRSTVIAGLNALRTVADLMQPGAKVIARPHCMQGVAEMIHDV